MRINTFKNRIIEKHLPCANNVKITATSNLGGNVIFNFFKHKFEKKLAQLKCKKETKFFFFSL